MKHWILHFEDENRNEVVREYPQGEYKKWTDVMDMIYKERAKGNPFFLKYSFNGKCALADLQEQKQKLAELIGKLIYH